MSFELTNYTVKKVGSSSNPEYHKNAQLLIQALVSLCPFLQMEAEILTSTEYSARLAVAGSVIKMKASCQNANSLSFLYGHLEGGEWKQTVGSNSMQYIGYSTSPYDVFEIKRYVYNEDLYSFELRCNVGRYWGTSYPHFGLLTSQVDGVKRAMAGDALFSTGKSMGVTAGGAGEVISIGAATAGGNTGYGKNGEAVLYPIYMNGQLGFMGFPTIGGGAIYTCTKAIPADTVFSLKGRRFISFGKNDNFFVEVT